MDAVRQWAFSLAAAMVAAGLARMLTPRGSMERIFRAAMSVFILSCLLSPFVLELPAPDLSSQPYPEAAIEERARRLEGAAASQAEDAIRWEAAKLVGEKLGELGINYHGVAIEIEQNGQSETILAEITLDRVHEPDHREIAAALEQALGFTVRLGYR